LCGRYHWQRRKSAETLAGRRVHAIEKIVVEQTANAIGSITPSGLVIEVPVPSPMAFPSAITAGPDGALWFVESGTGKIGRAAP